MQSKNITGHDQIFFFDAIAPIVYHDSIDFSIAYQGSRYGKNNGEDGGDYINCPMTTDEYNHFVDELIKAERIGLFDFERGISLGVTAGKQNYFEGCLPIEIIASRGRDALAYGPMRPVGLTDYRTGKHSYAVVQLRQDNLAKDTIQFSGFSNEFDVF